MSTTGEDIDDIKCSLWCFGATHSKRKITTQLENIQWAKVEQEKSRDFITHLECLRFSEQMDNTLLRQEINAYQQRDYVALSYTWEPSPLETNLRIGGYVVQEPGSSRGKTSPVRNNIFRRIRKYMEYNDVKFLWIDQHCIEQKRGEAKEIGMNAMDRVYSQSNHSVALLTRPIKSGAELRLLDQIIRGRMVYENDNGYSLSWYKSPKEDFNALRLLDNITSDMWFTRGWTFQENYRAGKNMKLLIPHHRKLERWKAGYNMESIRGELCISSMKFHTEATKFCIAYKNYHPSSRSKAKLCDRILSRAGRYTILLQCESDDGENIAPQSMSPRIIADIAARDLTNLWDRLPIVANCCQYSVRLNSTLLQAEGHSLAMSMLALCLLNGEILSNHPDEDIDVSEARSLPIVRFLDVQFFDALQSPFSDKALTYNKGCRFVDVKLTKGGIRTRGYLWRCDNLISTRGFWDVSRRGNSKSSTDGLDGREIGRLVQLANILGTRGEFVLTNRLRRFINWNRSTSRSQTFSQGWMIEMASVLADAIDRGKTLCTAHMVGSRKHRAIFIVDQHFEDRRYVFTSIRSKKEDSRWSDFNDVDKHVSLEVDLANPEDLYRGKRVPKLFTKRWINGLCFFGGPLRNVVFPWPKSLQGL
ncbi:hypothetical protein Hte_007922 [Hypoxylon texense]